MSHPNKKAQIYPTSCILYTFVKKHLDEFSNIYISQSFVVKGQFLKESSKTTVHQKVLTLLFLRCTSDIVA